MSKIKLYQGDCLNIMKKIPDKCINMVLCDLPYGTTNNHWDIIIPFDKLWKQYNRIVKDNAAILLFGQGRFSAQLICSNLNNYRYSLIWDKVLTSGFLNANRMPLVKHEDINVFYRNLPTYNPQFTIGEPLHSKGKSYLTKDIINNNYGKFDATSDKRAGSIEKYPTSIITFQKPHPSKSIHPTQKPIELLEYLIKTYTNESEIVLDNCMGSGSTGVACKKLNRNFIGIEIDKEYFNMAKERIENFNYTKKLF